MAIATHSINARAPNPLHVHEPFREQIDNIIEEAAFQLDIITALESRGWSLYEFGTGGAIASYLDLQHIVEMGREKKGLKFGIKYLLLPLNREDTNWEVVRDLLYMIVSQGRGPYFVDLEEVVDKETGDHWVEPIGVYLIDSVVLDPPFLKFILDPRMSRIKDPSRTKNLRNCEIALHVTCTHVIRQQIMKGIRVI